MAELVADAALADELREQLRGIYDLERLLARVATGRASPRDLSFVGRTLRALAGDQGQDHGPQQRAACATRSASSTSAPKFARGLEAALVDDCPLASREGGFIRDGFQRRARRAARAGRRRQAVDRPLPGRGDRSGRGIPSLKVGFNKVFGYYIEITQHAQRTRFPAHYIRKQTVKNAERYITPELKEYEEKVLTADEKAQASWNTSCSSSCARSVAGAAPRLQAHGGGAGAARRAGGAGRAGPRSAATAGRRSSPSRCCEIADGRHPVLDALMADGTFVPNDAQLRPRRRLDRC